MKLKRLDIEYEFDFVLFGLISSAKGFKLTWTINQALNINLVKRLAELEFQLKDDRSYRIDSYEFDTQTAKYLLFKNKLTDQNGNDAGPLLHELAKIDYFLRLDGETYPNTPDKVLKELKKISIVEYCMQINIDKLKSKENLLLY